MSNKSEIRLLFALEQSSGLTWHMGWKVFKNYKKPWCYCTSSFFCYRESQSQLKMLTATILMLFCLCLGLDHGWLCLTLSLKVGPMRYRMESLTNVRRDDTNLRMGINFHCSAKCRNCEFPRMMKAENM